MASTVIATTACVKGNVNATHLDFYCVDVNNIVWRYVFLFSNDNFSLVGSRAIIMSATGKLIQL
jgi:hypothetical protein